MTQSPIHRFNADRDAIIDDVIDRVSREIVQESWDAPDRRLNNLLNEAAYVELTRASDGTGADVAENARFWRQVVRTIARSSDEENADLIQQVVDNYARSTAGTFDARVQKLATELVPRGLGLVASTLRGGFGLPSTTAVSDRIHVTGSLEHVRRLTEVGTLVFVCPHLSRMDAAMMGFAMYLEGLPPLVHGADRHLFENPMTAYFMSRLGAYRVDRSLKNTLYNRVLKTYSRVLIERGYHSFFFPAGGRSRTGSLPGSLKLGLLGTALDAYTRNVLQRRDRPVFVVPVTINYNLVLEAQTLIEDYLEVHGPAQAVIEKDEFSEPLRVAAYFRSMMHLDEMVNVRIGQPLDVFGNRVDRAGASLDELGRYVDRERYLWESGVPTSDGQRAMAYTRQLGREVLRSFQENNVIAPIHVVAFALFEHVCRQHPNWTVERLLSFARGDVVSRVVAEGETERAIRLIRREANVGKFQLTAAASRMSAQEMVDAAVRLLGSYHESTAVEEHGKQLRLADLRLVYFYSNRLRGYDLERRLSAGPGGY